MTSGGNNFIDFPHQGVSTWVTGVHTPRGGLHLSHIRGVNLSQGVYTPQGVCIKLWYRSLRRWHNASLSNAVRRSGHCLRRIKAADRNSKDVRVPQKCDAFAPCVLPTVRQYYWFL